MHASPRTVTFILEELNFGGTQRQTLELARRLDRSRFSPRIWTLWAGMEMLSLAEAAHVPVTSLTLDTRLNPSRAVAALWRALRQDKTLRQNKSGRQSQTSLQNKPSLPDIVHLCTAFPNIWGRILGRLAQLPCIVASCRGQGNVRGQHEWALHRLAHAHVCNALSIAESLRERGVPESQLHYIPNGVDTEYFSPSAASQDSPFAAHSGGIGEILCVGRLVEDKDHETLLAALALLRHNMPARVHLVGDGPLRDHLRERARSLGLAEAVIFHGSDSDVRKYMRAADVLVLASRAEGMPNVILEGMACGLPVVGTRVGGIPDVVEHTVNGLLVAPARADALADALAKALRAGPEMGLAARKTVLERYSLETMTRLHEDVYAGLA